MSGNKESREADAPENRPSPPPIVSGSSTSSNMIGGGVGAPYLPFKIEMQSTSSTTKTQYLTEELFYRELVNPLFCELRYVTIVRSKSQSIDIETAVHTPSVVQVTKDYTDSSNLLQNTTTIPAGCYLLSINGAAATGQKDKDFPKTKKRFEICYALKRGRIIHPDKYDEFLGRYNAKSNHEYFIRRINFLDSPLNALRVSSMNKGRPYVSTRSKEEFLKLFHLNHGDVILYVNNQETNSLASCEGELKKLGKTYVDIVVERTIRRESVGNPSTEVPPIPIDVEKMMSKIREAVVSKIKKIPPSKPVVKKIDHRLHARFVTKPETAPLKKPENGQ